MDCLHYNLNRINQITENELIYSDDRGDLISIDLQKCKNRYLKYVNSHLEDYPETMGISIGDNDKFKYVADRYYNEFGIFYFEFYDWPHIRFESYNIKLFGLNWNRKYYNKLFYNIQKQLLDSGWHTYDVG